MNSPNSLWLKGAALGLFAAAALVSCSVSPNGPAGFGPSHGSLGSTNMCDYYYSKQAGWTYTFNNVENIYNSDGSVTTLTGAPDYVQTMGPDGFAPTGDSLFRIQITYRVLQQYAGRNPFDLWYVNSGNSATSGFVDGGANVPGMVSMPKRPKPVSTDTILAGVAGRIRTLVDDFSNTGTYVWQTDTLWLSSANDSVFIWERFQGATSLTRSRCLFTKDFVNNPTSNSHQSNVSWTYDLINAPTSTNLHVADPNMTLTVPAGTYQYTAEFSVDNTLNVPSSEHKWFSFGVGLTKQYDSWNITTDGVTFTPEDFTRTLISLTHN